MKPKTIPVVSSRAATIQRIIANFPQALLALHQWVLWRLVPRDGKNTKIPYQPNGIMADSTNSATWSDFDSVQRAYQANPDFSGVGFVFSKEDPYVGIDLDKCRDAISGAVEPWAYDILRQVPTYTELSPSGGGFHLIGKATLPPKGRRKDRIEMYDSGRYFTVTGDRFGDASSDALDIQAPLLTLHSQVFGAGKPPKVATQPPPPSATMTPVDPATDAVIVSHILASAEASRYQALVAGQWQTFGYLSQSEADLAFVSLLARFVGPHPDQIDRLFRSTGMMRPKWDEYRGTSTYGEITVAKAMEDIDTTNPFDDFLARMNKRFAFVKNGNQVRILEELDGGPDFRLYSRADFELVTNNIPFPGKGKSAAGTWLRSSNRREFDGIVFSPGRDVPGSYNLWRGFSIQPLAGDCALFWQLVREAVCAGSAELYTYVRRYFAHMIQKPWERPEVAIVLRGGQGVGKNTFVDNLGALVAGHFCEVSCVDQLTGRFNAHMRNAILIHANEATWGGNKSESGKLKAMITDATIPIEMKGVDILHIDNYMRLVVSSNNAWPVPVEADDRRFILLDVAPVFKQNTTFFAALHAQLANGGLAALMHDLMVEDISGFAPRNKPASPFGADIKIRSADTPTRWLFEVLNANAYADPQHCSRPLFDSATSPAEFAKDDLVNAYQAWCRESPERYPLARDQFFKRLRGLLGSSMNEARPAVSTRQKTPVVAKRDPPDTSYRPRVIVLASLAACRREFELAAGVAGGITWDEV